MLEDKLSLLEKLKAEHHELELRLKVLTRHLALSAQERMELLRLKKLKLATKDQIVSLEREA